MDPKIFKVGGEEVRIDRVELTKGSPFPAKESDELKELWAFIAEPKNWEALKPSNYIEFRPVTPGHLTRQDPFGGPNVAHMIWKININKGPISKETLNFATINPEWAGKTTGQPSSVTIRATGTVEPTPSTAPLPQITKADLAAALKLIQEWVPEERQNLETYKEAILSYAAAHMKIAADGPIRTTPMESHTWSDGTVTSHMPIQKDDPLRLVEYSSLKAELPSNPPIVTPCLEASGWAGVSTAWFIFGLIGFRGAPPPRELTRTFLAESWQKPAFGAFKKLFQDLRESKHGWEVAVNVFLVLKAVVNLGPAWVVRYLRHHLSWYEWAGFTLILIAQLTVWVLSDGLALIAQIALTVLSASLLTGDIVTAIKKCSGTA